MTCKTLWINFFLLFVFQTFYAVPIREQFEEVGYIEIYDTSYTKTTFDSLYTSFDEFITFLQTNPIWARKLHSLKERFIRSKDRNYYSSDFFGFYDESERQGKNQISFYYSTHFHMFICLHYPEFNQVPEIFHFFEVCRDIQRPCENLFNQASVELGLDKLFSSTYPHPSILFKVVKYLPSYTNIRPHYDGTLLTLFLDSTDNESLQLSPYKSSFTVDDFSSPTREFSNSILLIPGTLLTEFSIYPTPHIVVNREKTRYATVAFSMRPNYVHQKIELASLPVFRH